MDIEIRPQMGANIKVVGVGGGGGNALNTMVAANLAAYESAVVGMALNVGSGTNISIQEIADLISTKQVRAPRRAGDAEVTLADIGKITRLLKWTPRMSFADGLKQLLDAQDRATA